MSLILKRLQPSRSELVDGGFALLVLAIAVFGFRTSYGGDEYLVVALIAAVLGMVLAYGVVKFHIAPFPTIALALVSFVLLAGPVALREETIAGFIPTPQTFQALVDGIIRGWIRLLTTVAPAGGIDHLLAIPYMAGFFGGFVTMYIARRTMRLLPVIGPSVAVSAIAILFGTKVPASLIIQGSIFLAAALLWLSIRRERQSGEIISTSPGRSRWIGVALMLALSVAGATFFGPRMPLAQARERVVLREQTEPPFDPRDYPSPLSAFRKYRVDLSDEVLFTLDPVPEDAPWVRLAVMDDYDGVVWNVSGGGRAGAGYFERVGETIDQPMADGTFQSSLEIDGLTGVWAPTFGTTVAMNFTGDRADAMSDSFRYNSISGVAAVPIGLQTGDGYEMETGVVPDTDEDTLRRAAVDKTVVYEEIVGLPAEFEATAADIVAGASNPYDQAKALESYFQAGAYSDGGASVAVQVPPGHSIGHILHFIGEDELVGDDEQYAATMAVMARSVGLPARVVMGFQVEPSTSLVDVRGSDVAAWVEVALADVGWVPFYPTPDEANGPAEKKEQQLQKSQIETQVPPPISNPPSVPDPRVDKLENGDKQDDTEPPPLPGDDGLAGLGWLGVAVAVAIGTPLVGWLVFVVFVWLLKLRRRAGRRRGGTPARRISRGWREILDLAYDQRREMPRLATRHEAAVAIGGSLPTLASVADARVFGAYEPTDDDAKAFWSGVQNALWEMRFSTGYVARIKAATSVRSLRRVNKRK